MRKLSIIVPVYNEEKTIGAVLQKLGELNLGDWEKEIIIVDDGSTSSLSPPVRWRLRLSHGGEEEGVKFTAHKKNLGKGAAIKTGLELAIGDYVIIQDADLEYDLEDIPRLLAEAAKTNAQAIFGSRNLEPKRRGYPHYVLGVYLLTVFTNMLYGAKLTDVYTCYKLIQTSVLKSLDLKAHGFEFEAEVTTKLLRRGVEIREIPIDYYPRTFSEGKKIRWRDGAKGLWTILKYWL